MSADDQSSKYTSNVSTEAAVDLSDFVESLELENGIYKAYAQDIENIKQFLSKQFNVISLVQIQSFCATKNDHTSLSALNENMRVLIQFANVTPELHNAVKPLILELISSHNIKVFYRCFSNEHISVSIPAIGLLTEIVAFGNGCFIDQFLEHFDLSLKNLKDLLYPTKASAKFSGQGKSHTTVRHFMSIFWITLCSNASPLTRSDLLSNYKPINLTWIKYTTEFDNADLIKKMFKFFDEKVLMEPAYRKMTKCKLLGDNTLSKFVDLFGFEGVADEAYALLTKITTDEVNGLLFHDYRTWFNNVPNNVLPSNSSFNNSGVPIVIGENKFKINNKIIYKILTSLKPWADSLHLKLAVSILSHVPELSAPYTAHLFHTNGAHDPKMTSFYIGQTLILTKITQLPIPTEFVSMIKQYISDITEESTTSNKSTSYLSTKLLMEVICPAQLNRSALTQGLTADNQMTRHLTVQLIVSIIQKFNRVYKLLNFNENPIFISIRNELKDTLINTKLPDASAIVGSANECMREAKLNKLLLLNYMKAAECYHKVLDINVSLQLGSFNNILGLGDGTKSSETSFISQSKMTDVDLLLFNSYLTLTAISSISNQHNKWWNVAKGSKNTLFTTIAKLPYDLQYKEDESSALADNTLITKVVEVLANFLDDSIAFEDYKSPSTTVLNSQAWAIVLSLLNTFNSLKDNKQDIIDAICKVLDESISRSLRTPYKYYDVITKQSNDLKLKNTRASAFFVALCEQSKFAKPEHNEYINQWIKLLTVYLYLLGESLPIMKSLVKEYREFDIEFDVTTYESFIKSNSELSAELSNFTNVAFTPWNKLRTKVNSLIPKLDIEIIAVIDRIQSIIEFNVDFKQVEDLLLDLLSLYGNYMVHKYSGVIDDEMTVNNVELLEKKYWINLFVTIDEAESTDSSIKQKLNKKYFVMGLVNEIFKSLWNNQISISFKNSLRDCVYDLVNNDKISDIGIKQISEFLWVLNDKQVNDLIVTNEFNECTESLLDIAIARNIKFESGDIMKYCGKSTDMNGEVSRKFAQLMKDTSYDDAQTLELIELVKSNGNHNLLFSILENTCKRDTTKVEFISEKLSNEFENIAKSLEGFKFLQSLSVSHVDLRAQLYEISTKKVDSILKSDAKVDDSLNFYLYSIALYGGENPSEEIQKQIGELISLDSIRNVASLIFSPQMTQLVFSLYGSNENSIINTWLHRAILYTTKVFAETTADHLSVEFEEFLRCLQRSLHSSVWKYVSKSMVNSQLEVILSKGWVKHATILKYTTWIIMTGSKNVVECVRLVNIFLNNVENVLICSTKDEEARYYSALILSYLVKMNLKQLSSFDILFKIVKLYRGTVFASDLVLKDLLMHIEQENGESWIQFVSNWDLIDEWLPSDSNGENENSGSNKIVDVPEFIMDTPGLTDCLTVNLHKIIIENTVKNFDTNKRSIRIPELEKKIESQEDDFAKLEEFYELKKVDSFEIDGEVTYDVEFILLLIVNNEDLFKIVDESVVVNIRALIDTWLLQLTICGLAHEVSDVNEISKRIISSIILNIEDDIKNLENKKDKEKKIEDSATGSSVPTFKERSAFKIYLCDLLYTFEDKKNVAVESGNAVEPVSKMFIIFLSYLTPILANPAHFLYEKAYRFILGGSKYRDYEIPMYKTIMVEFTKDEHTKGSDDDGDYYKQLQWILRTLGASITNKEDLKIIRRNEVIEQLLNLMNSPFISYGLQESIIAVFEKIIRLENGSDLLIRSFGLLSFVESRGLAKKNRMWAKYSKLAMKTIVGSECNGKDKRAMEWCNDDFGNAVKRVCM